MLKRSACLLFVPDDFCEQTREKPADPNAVGFAAARSDFEFFFFYAFDDFFCEDFRVETFFLTFVVLVALVCVSV